jgi:hypothetical protein
MIPRLGTELRLNENKYCVNSTLAKLKRGNKMGNKSPSFKVKPNEIKGCSGSFN